MRFTTFLKDGQPRLGLVLGQDVIDLNAAQPQVPPDLRLALRAGVDLAAAGAEAAGAGTDRPWMRAARAAGLLDADGSARPTIFAEMSQLDLLLLTFLLLLLEKGRLFCGLVVLLLAGNLLHQLQSKSPRIVCDRHSVVPQRSQKTGFVA